MVSFFHSKKTSCKTRLIQLFVVVLCGSVGYVTNTAFTLAQNDATATTTVVETIEKVDVATSTASSSATSTLVATSSATKNATSSQIGVNKKPLTSRKTRQLTAPEKFTRLATNIAKELGATTARLYEIHMQLEIRVKKQSEAGIEVADLEAQLEEVLNELREAETELATIQSDIYIVSVSSRPKGVWPQLKSRFVNSQKHLTQALELLKEISHATRNR